MREILRPRLLGTRVLGVGVAAALAAVTLALAVTGQLGLYINPESAWFAVAMAIFALVGTVASFALPLGAEQDHGHDHGDGAEHASADPHDHAAPERIHATAVVGGVLAVGVVGAIVLVPPATLSAEIAMSRDTGAPPLFQGADTVALATTADTSEFGVGEWATVFATATNPEAFDGDAVTLTGFVTPDDGGADFDLSRLVITHCVIDAQSASIPITGADAPATGQWVTVTGTVRDVDGALELQAASVEQVDQPDDPYEY